MSYRYDGIIDVPAGVSNDYAIVHHERAAGKPVPLSNLRNAMMRGTDDPVEMTFPHPTRWHELRYDGGTWMTDYPIEQRQMEDPLSRMTGNVLVGGLGLGVFPARAARRSTVESVTVVERSPDVARLVWPHRRGPGSSKISLIPGTCLFAAMANELEGTLYDSAFFDIWQRDGESTFHGVVVPLRVLAWRNAVVKTVGVECWNETTMRSQLYMALTNRIRATTPEWHDAFGDTGTAVDRDALEEFRHGPGAEYWNWAVPFFRFTRGYAVERLDDLASSYVRAYFVTRPWFHAWASTQYVVREPNYADRYETGASAAKLLEQAAWTRASSIAAGAIDTNEVT